MMRGAARGRSTTRKECTNAMQGAVCATPENIAKARALVLGAQAQVLGMVQVLNIMHFFCQATVLYLTLVRVIVSAQTPNNFVGESPEPVGGACLDDVDGKAMPNSFAEESSEAVRGSAAAVVQAKRAKRVTMIALLAALTFIQRVFFLKLHEDLQKQAKENFEDPGLDLNESGAEEWSVLFRAGGPWHGGPANQTWRSQALPATCDRKCFLLHLGAFGSALGGKGEHLVVPVDDATNDWRGAVLERIRALDSRLVPLVASLPCLLNGKELSSSCPPQQLQDLTLRVRAVGLLGGAPKAKKIDKGKNVDKMEKSELMVYAKDVLGVETRRASARGKTNTWRSVSDVRNDCKAAQAKLGQPEMEAQARLCQRSETSE